MNLILSAILPYVLLYRYAAIFAITFFASFIVPLPSNTTVLAAASFASQGFFDVQLVFLTALAGNVCGDLTGYWLSRAYAQAALRKGLEKWPPTRRFLEKVTGSTTFRRAFDRAEKQLDRYAPLTIFLTRFSTALGPVTNIASGALGVPFRIYFPYEFLGELANALIFTAVGYLLGVEGESVTDIAVALIFAASFTWLGAMIARKYWKNRSRGPGGKSDGEKSNSEHNERTNEKPPL